MAHRPRLQIHEEWRRSVAALQDILGETIRVASVPGGGYSNEVGAAAAAVGIRTLFISEPTLRVRSYDAMTVLGRSESAPLRGPNQ